MTREESIKLLQVTRLMLMDGANQPISDLYYALGMAIEALEQTELNSSEKPNNCEHITEDGVTCAKYPACDDCLDNPLNKVKGSERLVKGKDEPTISKMEQVETMSCAECKHRPIGAEICEEPCHYEPQTERHLPDYSYEADLGRRIMEQTERSK